jgi:hypothetical protein
MGDNAAGGSRDLKSATAGHTASGLLKHTIVQYNAIDKSNPPAVVMDAPKKGCAYGYVIWPAHDAKRLFKPCTDTFVGRYTKSYPDSRTVVYKFSKGAIGNPSKYYWAIRIYGSGEGNIDELPDYGNSHARCDGPVIGGTICTSNWYQWMVLHRLP